MEEITIDQVSNYEIIMGILYGVTAIVLLFTAYVLFIKRYKVQKTEAVNNIEFITSRYNIFTESAQFLFVVPNLSHIKLEVLDENEQYLNTLVDTEYEEGEHIFYFDINQFKSGIYFLKLTSENVNILRKIKINHA